MPDTNLTAHLPFELEASWQNVLKEELKKPYLVELAAFVARERAGPMPIYPPAELVFNAFQQTPYEKVKVVIIGQDPYHGPNQAHGLCFSVPHGIKPPPSLKNIFKELQHDVGVKTPEHGCLQAWAAQGVMLLNAVLTVRQGEPNSHRGMGWEKFTDAVVRVLCKRQEPVIFVLWGKFAQDKCRHFIEEADDAHHTVLLAPHPSPFSAYQGFFGCHHFSQINEILLKRGAKPIEWDIC